MGSIDNLRRERSRCGYLLCMAILLAIAAQQGCGSGNNVDRLLSDDSKVRQETIAQLQGVPLVDALDKLISRLSDERCAGKAARALTEIGVPAVPPLCRMVNGPVLPSSAENSKRDIGNRQRDAKARARAISVLGSIGTPDAVSGIL
jgi:hypothetical protein